MKIYTKQGDRGQTSLLGGAKVPKSHPRVNAYGAVDELNSLMGLTLAHAQTVLANETFFSQKKTDGSVKDLLLEPWLLRLQNELFLLGTELASPQKIKKMPTIDQSHITQIENEIDMLSEQIPELKNFILPGGHIVSAFLHQCRSAARRAERETVYLSSQENIRETVIIYLNRLSDALFQWARYVNDQTKTKEIIWQG